MVTTLLFMSGLFFGASIAGYVRPDGVVMMTPLVVRAQVERAPTELQCRTIPLRNGRPGETVRMCEHGLP